VSIVVVVSIAVVLLVVVFPASVVASDSVVVATLLRFPVVVSIVVVAVTPLPKIPVVVVSSAVVIILVAVVVALPRNLALSRALPKALPNVVPSLARVPSVVVENVVVVSAPVVVASEHTSSVLQTVSKQLDSKTRPLMLEDKLLSEVDTTEEEEEIAEAWDELEDSDFKIDNKEDEEPEETEHVMELECAEDELEDQDSNSELELEEGEFEKLSVEEGEDIEEDNFELLVSGDEELLVVEDPVLIEELLHTSTEEHTSTCLQFLRVVVVAVLSIAPAVMANAVVVAALPRIPVVAVVVSSEHCSSYLHTLCRQLEEELDMLENGDKHELEMLDELTISVDELEDDASEEERDEDKIELLGDDEELSELDEEVKSNEQDDELEKSELLSTSIEDDELIDEENSEELPMLLLHTSTVLQTWTS